MTIRQRPVELRAVQTMLNTGFGLTHETHLNHTPYEYGRLGHYTTVNHPQREPRWEHDGISKDRWDGRGGRVHGGGDRKREVTVSVGIRSPTYIVLTTPSVLPHGIPALRLAPPHRTNTAYRRSRSQRLAHRTPTTPPSVCVHAVPRTRSIFPSAARGTRSQCLHAPSKSILVNINRSTIVATHAPRTKWTLQKINRQKQLLRQDRSRGIEVASTRRLDVKMTIGGQSSELPPPNQIVHGDEQCTALAV
ncbi:hypothetical protein B0H11DRAFT_1898619 [Mycena galericulata]|nr:hypothetical protein B0H11DRAFT_1898619 [Mycena galericulata]